MISIKEAKDLITEIRDDDFAHGRSHKTWYTYHNHVYGTAELSSFLAKLLKLDEEKSYIMGLLHDIGKIKGDRVKRFHGIVGYEIAENIDYMVARTSLLHTFPYNELPTFSRCKDLFFDNKDDFLFTHNYISNTNYDDYDLLVQMTDNMAYVRGFVTIEERIIDWCKRKNKPLLQEHINPLNKLKAYFESKLNVNIYSLFDDIDKSYLID